MKSFIAGLLCAVLSFGGGIRVENCNTFIHKGGYFGDKPFTAIIRTSAEMDAWKEEHCDPWLSDGVNQFYEKYGAEFFKTKNLVLATVAHGSGSIKYWVETVTCNGGVLTVNVRRTNPMIQTMDYVHWVVSVEIDKTYDFDRAEVVLTVAETTKR